jgi:hypothetical protein
MLACVCANSLFYLQLLLICTIVDQDFALRWVNKNVRYFDPLVEQEHSYFHRSVNLGELSTTTVRNTNLRSLPAAIPIKWQFGVRVQVLAHLYWDSNSPRVDITRRGIGPSTCSCSQRENKPPALQGCNHQFDLPAFPVSLQ